MRFFVRSILLAAFAVSAVLARPAPVTAASEEAASPQISLQQVVVGDKFSAYTGEGPATAPPEKAIVDQAIVSYVVVKSANGKPYSYIAKDVSPEGKDATLVHIRLLVTNPSAVEQPFHILDVGLRAPGGKLVGLGQGPIAFVKDEASLKQVKEEEKPIKLAPGEKRQLTYIYEMPKGSRKWILTYKGKDLAELTNQGKAG